MTRKLHGKNDYDAESRHDGSVCISEILIDGA